MTTTLALVGLAALMAAPIGIVWALERDLARRRHRQAAAAAARARQAAPQPTDPVQAILDAWWAALAPTVDAVMAAIRDVTTFLSEALGESWAAIVEAYRQAPDSTPDDEVSP